MSLNIIDKLEQNINSDPNTNYEILIAEIENACEKHTYYKLVKYNKYKHKKSTWITQGITRFIKIRYRLYKKLKIIDHNFNVTLIVNYTSYNNILKSSTQSAKLMHYTHIFNKFKNDMRKTIQEI